MDNHLSLILLSGGKGLRVGGTTPKQYTLLGEKPLILHSLDTFLSIPLFNEVVIVCGKEYKHFFKGYKSAVFAEPGSTRQSSVKNGFLALSDKNAGVLIHDGARPFVKREDILSLIHTGERAKAATLANKATSTIKLAVGSKVQETLKRESLWETQTPQYLSYDLLKEGIEFADRENHTVTDDVSFAELLNHPVELVEACKSNTKVTTATDLEMAKLKVGL
ncbi:MAG: 2-C-methyl-D-erythritol 4-phosphate cytidylyltransferase [Chlamydiia bacterium]|nr:2-C-methyl-D-erythritol 4-phosphate cytidylyltransferase [Chlamydiia bacterium]